MFVFPQWLQSNTSHLVICDFLKQYAAKIYWSYTSKRLGKKCACSECHHFRTNNFAGGLEISHTFNFHSLWIQLQQEDWKTPWKFKSDWLIYPNAIVAVISAVFFISILYYLRKTEKNYLKKIKIRSESCVKLCIRMFKIIRFKFPRSF